jgi:CheY-like chemotaxis protein
MVNSTKITANISNYQKIGQYYSIFINTMAVLTKNYGGKIVKNAGDALIFYFPQTSDPGNEQVFKDAFECFTTMILAHDIINSKLHSENLPSVSYRISADYGRVEVATSTSSKREDLFGSTMNVCAKINSMAQPYGIVIGRDLHQLVSSFSFSNEYEFGEVRGYSVGFKSPYPVYAIVAKNRSALERSRMNLISSKISALGSAQARATQKQYFANIMVVDDEPDILFTYKSLLSSEGHNIEAFTDPQEALKHFVQLPDPSSHYQLVLLDIRMPRLNGIQLFYKIKTLSPNTRIMFCSALDIAEELVSILPDIKYSDIIKKPVKREYFISKINSVLNNSSTAHFGSLNA